jgi:hypothetical protein
LITTEAPSKKYILEDFELKIVLLATIGIILISLTACSMVNEDNKTTNAPQKAKFRNRTRSKLLFHGGDMDTPSSAAPESPVLKSLKENHLEVSQTKTIGDAFDAYKYAIKKEWRETPTNDGPYYIDYIGWFSVSPFSAAALRDGVVKRALNLKFVIQKDGDAYISMASRVDVKTDGMIHTSVIEPTEIKKIVTAIYENREITF